jgi:preprotein translocase subunit YajC
MNLMTLFFLAPAGGGDASLMWIMMIAIFVIMYFFMIRPQSKKQKEISNFRKTIKVGQKVITAGGIHGEIKKLMIISLFWRLPIM